FFHNPGDVRTDNYWTSISATFRQHPLSYISIHRVHANGLDADEHFVLLRLRTQGIFILQYLWASVLMNDDCLHHGCGLRYGTGNERNDSGKNDDCWDDLCFHSRSIVGLNPIYAK